MTRLFLDRPGPVTAVASGPGKVQFFRTFVAARTYVEATRWENTRTKPFRLGAGGGSCGPSARDSRGGRVECVGDAQELLADSNEGRGAGSVDIGAQLLLGCCSLGEVEVAACVAERVGAGIIGHTIIFAPAQAAQQLGSAQSSFIPGCGPRMTWLVAVLAITLAPSSEQQPPIWSLRGSRRGRRCDVGAGRTAASRVCRYT